MFSQSFPQQGETIRPSSMNGSSSDPGPFCHFQNGEVEFSGTEQIENRRGHGLADDLGSSSGALHPLRSGGVVGHAG